MTPKRLLVLVCLAALAGCNDSATNEDVAPMVVDTAKAEDAGKAKDADKTQNTPDTTPNTENAPVVEPVVKPGTYNSSFLEDNGDYTYRQQITFAADGTFEFVDYETPNSSSKITSYTTFLGTWKQADSSITLSKTRSIYHTTFSDETNEDETFDPPAQLVLGTKLRITSDASFSLVMPDGVRLDFTKADKIQFAF